MANRIEIHIYNTHIVGKGVYIPPYGTNKYPSWKGFIKINDKTVEACAQGEEALMLAKTPQNALIQHMIVISHPYFIGKTLLKRMCIITVKHIQLLLPTMKLS